MITDKQVEAAFASWMGEKRATDSARSLIIPELRAALEAAEAARDADSSLSEIEGVLHEIAELAHDHSTGPTVPDVLWQIRTMAYDAFRAPIFNPPAAPSSAEQPGKVCMESNFPDTDSWARRRFVDAPGAPEADERDVFELYKLWPADVRAKLSCHDLRRMNIAARAQSSVAPSVAPVSARHSEAVLFGIFEGEYLIASRKTADEAGHYIAERAAEFRAAGCIPANMRIVPLYTAPPADAREGELRERCAQIAESADVAPTDDPLGVQQSIADMIRRDQLTRPLNDRAMGGE